MSRSYFTVAAAVSALVGLLPSDALRSSEGTLGHSRERATNTGEKPWIAADPSRTLLLMLGEFQPLEPVVGLNGSSGDRTSVEAAWVEAIPVPGPAAACLLAIGGLMPPKSRSRPVRCSCCGRWHV